MFPDSAVIPGILLDGGLQLRRLRRRQPPNSVDALGFSSKKNKNMVILTLSCKLLERYRLSKREFRAWLVEVASTNFGDIMKCNFSLSSNMHHICHISQCGKIQYYGWQCTCPQNNTRWRLHFSYSSPFLVKAHDFVYMFCSSFKPGGNTSTLILYVPIQNESTWSTVWNTILVCTR